MEVDFSEDWGRDGVQQEQAVMYESSPRLMCPV